LSWRISSATLANTTNIYAETDLETKAKALAHCEVPNSKTKTARHWRDDRDLMSFLQTLWCSPKKSGLLIPYEENPFNSGGR
jgi:hypothetical protein